MEEITEYLTQLSTQEHNPYHANWDVLLLLPLVLAIAFMVYDLLTSDSDELFRR